VTLRDYQARAVEVCEAATEPVLVVSPTGSGKGHMIAELARRAPTLVLAHREEIVRDLAQRVGHARTLVAGRWEGPATAPVTVALVQSLDAGAVTLPGLGRIVTDEAHHAVASTYRALYARHPGARHAGFSATPSRGDGRGLGDVYARLHVAATPRELLERGLLAPVTVLAPPTAGVALADDAARAYERYGDGRRAVVFVATVHEAEQLAARWPVPCGVVTGETRDRAELLARFAAGDLRTLINVYVLTEGTDVPEAEVCVLARGCTSAATYLQIVGRVLRPLPGKRALLVDLRGAVHVHGLPHDDRTWSLSGTTGRAAVSVETLRTCRECWYVYRGAVCPACGAAPPAPKPPVVSVRPLREVVSVDPGRRAALLRGLCRKHSNPAQVRVIYWRMTGAWPTAEDLRNARG